MYAQLFDFDGKLTHGRLAIALATLSAVRRLHLALWLNQRYRLTTWRWGRVTALLLVAGAMLKLLAQL